MDNVQAFLFKVNCKVVRNGSITCDKWMIRFSSHVYSCFDKGCLKKAYATMPIGIMGRKSLALIDWGSRFLPTREGISTFVCVVSIYVVETPKARIKDHLLALSCMVLLDNLSRNSCTFLNAHNVCYYVVYMHRSLLNIALFKRFNRQWKVCVCICMLVSLLLLISVNQVATLLVIYILHVFIMHRTHLTFASASTLGLSDSKHSVAFRNLSRKSTIVGTEI